MDKQQRFTWMRRDYLLVPALVREQCSGCEFQHEPASACPNTGPGGKKFCYSEDARGEFVDDHIVILDDPQCIADYVQVRLGIDDEFDDA